MKSKILLLTTLLASANTIFAQSYDGQQIVYKNVVFEIAKDKNGNEDITIDENAPGMEGTRSPIESATYYGNNINVTKTEYKVLTGQHRQVNVKAVATTGTIKPGQIISWSNATPRPDVTEKESYDTYITQFGKDARTNKAGGYQYEVDVNDPDYKQYEKVCSLAIKSKNPINLMKGMDAALEKDVKGVKIHKDLFYYEDYRVVDIEDEDGKVIDQDMILEYYPITRTTGGVNLETTMYDCYDDYTPTEIDPAIKFDVTEGNLGVVSGVVDNTRINTLAQGANKNLDFSECLILGSINLNIPANKLAYFPAGIAASGTNIVIDGTCSNYEINEGSDIYVSEAFIARKSSFYREFDGNSFATIVLPFAVASTSNIFEKQTKLDRYDAAADKITFRAVENIAPNTPYLVKTLSAGVKEINGDPNASVYATPSSSKIASQSYNGLEFIGTFASIPGAQMKGTYGVDHAGKIGYSNTTYALKPGRAFLKYTKPSTSAKFMAPTIEIIDEDGSVEIIESDFEATAIDNVEGETAVSVQYISANGQISNEPFNGLNIVKKTYADGSVKTSKVSF